MTPRAPPSQKNVGDSLFWVKLFCSCKCVQTSVCRGLQSREHARVLNLESLRTNRSLESSCFEKFWWECLEKNPTSASKFPWSNDWLLWSWSHIRKKDSLHFILCCRRKSQMFDDFLRVCHVNKLKLFKNSCRFRILVLITWILKSSMLNNYF